MKIIIVIFLIAIIVSLASGLRFLVKDTGNQKRTVRALTWRVALSIAFVVFLAISFYAGWLHPHGLHP